MGATAAEIEVDKIMENCDLDKNGFIEYSEFISASINKRNLMTKERLKAAFEMFDRDQDGFISQLELK